MHPEDISRVFTKVGLVDLENVAKWLLEELSDIKLWLFYGEMGSGKTTFIKAICKVLGVQDQGSSPTFSIVNEYLIDGDNKVFHFDFYRIQREVEAYEIGTEEYFFSGKLCFVEWPEKIPSLIPDTFVRIEMMDEDHQHRNISISVHVGKEENRF